MPSLDHAALSFMLRDDTIQATFVKCFLNGIFMATVCLTLYAIISKNGWKFFHRPMIVSMLVMYAFATFNLVVSWERARNAFIDNGQTEDKTSAALLTGTLLSLSMLGDILFIMNMAVADGVLIWRCWVIWNRNWKVVVLPIILVMVELASGIVRIVVSSHTSLISSSDLESLFISMQFTNLAASLVSTLLTTTLMIFRILSVGGPKFGTITEIVVESAVFYSIALIFNIGFLLSDKFSNLIPDKILSQVTGLAPTLMLARVAFGLARPDSSWNEPVSILHFGSRAQSRRANQSVYGSEVVSTDHIGLHEHVNAEVIESGEGSVHMTEHAVHAIREGAHTIN